MSAEEYDQLAARAQPNGNTDPRSIDGGGIPDPGTQPGTYANVKAVLDATDAILVDSFQVGVVATFADRRPGPERVYLTLGGRINKSRQKVQVGAFISPEAAAALIAELSAVMFDGGPDMLAHLGGAYAQADHDGKLSLGVLTDLLHISAEVAARRTPPD